MKVLVVDDSAIVRERVIELLLESGQVGIVGEAEDSRTALKAVRELQPDIVVLDIHLPTADGQRVESGIPLLRQFKSQHPAPAVIMLSNFSHPNYRDTCRKLGADAFLDKSDEFERLPDVVKALVPAMFRARPSASSPRHPA